MVDALNETKRVLRSGGVLIDYRPTVDSSPIEVVRSDTSVMVGAVDDSNASSDNAAATAAIQGMVEAGVFAVNYVSRFEVAYYWDSLEEMSDYLRTRRHPMGFLPSEQEVRNIVQSISVGPFIQLRCRWRCQITTYV